MYKYDNNYLPVLFGKIKKQILKDHNEILTPHNLSSIHAMYLMSLNKQQGLTQKELNKFLHVNKANTSRAINELIKKGYAYKEDSNERNVKVYITDRGKDLAILLESKAKKINSQLFSVLTTEEKETFNQALRKMIAVNLDE